MPKSLHLQRRASEVRNRALQSSELKSEMLPSNKLQYQQEEHKFLCEQLELIVFCSSQLRTRSESELVPAK
jgi:hypothetical protein